MTEPKFTKGDWRVSLDSITSNGIDVADIVFMDGEEENANAHLIAAAPEMYEELNLIANEMFDIGKPTIGRRIEKLLAKARGEQNDSTKQ